MLFAAAILSRDRWSPCAPFTDIFAPLANRYSDDEFEYRHVQLPKAMLKAIPKEYFDNSKGVLKLLWEDEWRSMGITQVWRRAQAQRDRVAIDCGDAIQKRQSQVLTAFILCLQ